MLEQQCGQRLEVETSDLACVEGSRKLLAQAIGNLIENAIKYAPAGTTIRMRVQRTGAAIELIVSDGGPGIPDWERKRVLERIVRLEGSRHNEGNGLGLSLAKAVASLHQAELLLGDARPGLRVTMRFAAD